MMAYQLIITPEAAMNMAEAVDWYDNQHSGLGREFIHYVDELFGRIRSTPEIYPIYYRNARLALVRRFP